MATTKRPGRTSTKKAAKPTVAKPKKAAKPTVAKPKTGPDSTIPAGFTYVGQFIDHDITLDVSSTLDAATNANTIHKMRSPSLDLDSVYGHGPALDPYLYAFPSAASASASPVGRAWPGTSASRSSPRTS